MGNEEDEEAHSPPDSAPARPAARPADPSPGTKSFDGGIIPATMPFGLCQSDVAVVAAPTHLAVRVTAPPQRSHECATARCLQPHATFRPKSRFPLRRCSSSHVGKASARGLQLRGNIQSVAMATQQQQHKKHTTNIQLDKSWRDEMEGTLLATQTQSTPAKQQHAAVDEDNKLEEKVIAQATAQAAADLEAETQALRQMTIKTVGQATEPTSAPAPQIAPQPSTPRGRRPARSRHSSSYSSGASSSSSSTSRARHRRRRGRSLQPRSPPPGVFVEEYAPPQHRRDAPALPDSTAPEPEARIFRIKLLQVVDDAVWDAEIIMRNFVDARFQSPTVLMLKTCMSEKRVISIVHEFVHSKFRVC